MSAKVRLAKRIEFLRLDFIFRGRLVNGNQVVRNGVAMDWGPDQGWGTFTRTKSLLVTVPVTLAAAGSELPSGEKRPGRADFMVFE